MKIKRGEAGYAAEVTKVKIGAVRYPQRGLSWKIEFQHVGIGGCRATTLTEVTTEDLVALQARIVSELAKRIP